MHDHDALGLRSDGRLDRGRIEVERLGVDIDEPGRRADIAHAPSRRDKRKRRHDDFVAGSPARDHGGEVERRSAAVQPKGARITKGLGKVGLKIIHILAETEAGGVVSRRECGERLLAESLVLKRKIEERDFHG